jgi:hypothetical protein
MYFPFFKKIMANSQNIKLPKDLKINSKDPKSFAEPFTVEVIVSHFLEYKKHAFLVQAPS